MNKLPQLILSQTSRQIGVFSHWRDDGYLELNAPYQRGDIWGEVRRQNLIKSLIMGVPVPSIIINDRFEAGWGEELVVIDGKQRITTILMFFDNLLKIPGEWMGVDKEFIKYGDLDKPEQRFFKNRLLQICEGRVKSVDLEREIFELINFGGVPQGESDY